MATREEFVAAVQTVDARLDALRDRILADSEAPLNEGSWRIRDALSHLAARANGVNRVLARLEPRPDGQAAPAPRNIDEINAGQVEERTDRTAEQLLDEIRDGHRAALEAIADVDDATLAQVLPLGFRPGEAAVADLMSMGGPRHDHGHIDQIEVALER